MAKVTCAISGLAFQCDHLPIVVNSNDGYYHPIFALPYKKLYGLYSKHCSGHLTPTDSYLLFLAFLHSTEKVVWEVPAAFNPTTTSSIAFVENNLKQLIEMVELTNLIHHPSFKQPKFKVDINSSDLQRIPGWIIACNDNIESFYSGYKRQLAQESKQKIENKLSYYIKSGGAVKEYAHIVAAWADKAASFPTAKREHWLKIIRTCFDSSKMFSTSLVDLKEVKSYCEENIEVGSIHFHTLMETLREGISRHTDFLGMNPIALGYTLVDTDHTRNEESVAAILADAPTDAPKRGEYTSALDFLKARLKYRTAAIAKNKENT